MINSRNIHDLHPEVQILCEKFLTACMAEDIDIIITSTYRDNESQDALYSQGRTTIGLKITNAHGGESWHNYRLAFDFVPLTHGKPDWQNIQLFNRCGEIGESVGLEWAGRWKSFKELAHLQYTAGHNLAYFKQGGVLV